MVGETGAIARTLTPRTRASLGAELRALGVRLGETLLVHSSLSALGWVIGGQVAVVQALLDAVGPAGTVVVPTQSTWNSDPSEWHAPPVPAEWWPTIRANLPAYDPATSPGRGMGQISEAVRTWPGAVRSAHPQTSFAAVGPQAAALLAVHDLDCRFGDRSPLAALAKAGAKVLLLGAGFDSCTSFHLAETRIVDAPTEQQSCAMTTHDGGRGWVTYTDTVADEGDFATIGEAYQATGAVTSGWVGSTWAGLFDLSPAVAFAADWIRVHRADL